MQSGDLRDRIAFLAPGAGSGEAGNTRAGPFTEQFRRWANSKPVNGGEEVMAGRVQGTRTVLFTLHNLASTRTATTEWQVRDEHTKEVFSIREIKQSADRRWLEILAQSGVAP